MATGELSAGTPRPPQCPVTPPCHPTPSPAGAPRSSPPLAPAAARPAAPQQPPGPPPPAGGETGCQSHTHTPPPHTQRSLTGGSQLPDLALPGCLVPPDHPFARPQDGIEPMWEDNQNKRGGRWLITLAKQQRHTELDRFWLETLLCLIGEMFDDYSDEVCGAVINIRAKGDKIAIWTREAENREGVTHIGRVYKEHLGLSQKVAIGYQAHADTATKSGSLTKTKFVV
uniref:Eukaryotic translation initiation factor 4E family member 1B n=1 Tax=Calidris pygmaea TaxID=425635 RepID=A0A8C3PRB6_9CHAR